MIPAQKKKSKAKQKQNNQVKFTLQVKHKNAVSKRSFWITVFTYDMSFVYSDYF